MSLGNLFSRLPACSAWMVVAACTFSSAVSFSASSDDIGQAHLIEKQNISEQQQSQLRVNKSSDHAFRLQAEIAALEAEAENLTIYRDHLGRLVFSQEQEIASLDQQLAQIDDTKRSVVPLMYRMLDGLEAIIASDKPVRIQARQRRLNKLKTMMAQANISDAEKYRRILEAYQIELDYGTKLGSYKGVIRTDNVEREAEQLYIGRVVLVARSLDRSRFWSWDTERKRWHSLSPEYGSEINKAFAIANKQASPDILTLPVSVKEGES